MDDERLLLGLLCADFALLRTARIAGLEPCHFSDSDLAEAFDWVGFCSDSGDIAPTPHDGPEVNAAIKQATERASSVADKPALVTRLVRELIADAKSRPPVEHQVPEREHDEAQPDSDATAQPERKPSPARPRPQWQRRPPGRNGSYRQRRTGFPQGRINQRRGDLWAVHRHELKKRNQRSTNETFDAYVAGLERAFAPRDVLDPDAVTAAELGRRLRITLALRVEIEHEETAWRIAHDWPQTGPYKLKTIRPRDMSGEQVARYYAKQRKANHRQRNEEQQPMSTTQATTTRRNGIIYRQSIEAQVALTRHQLDQLHGVIHGKRTTSDLLVLIRDLPAWGQVPEHKLRATLIDRLDTLEDEGRIVTVGNAPGPRGSRLRIVQRTESSDLGNARLQADFERPYRR